MRYAFVSDLHANLQAWQTVLADLTAMKVDHVVCLGDVIGYGPRPAEVLASAYAHVDHFVLGNHDAVIGEFMDANCFNDDAQQMIAWTRSQLDQKAVDFFRKVPLAVAGPGFRAVHGSPDAPEQFGYIFDENDARLAWEHFDEDLLLVGHTHEPMLHYLNRDGLYRCVDAVDFEIETGKRYIVNVGSVGMPRDADFRACYAIYDSEEPSIVYRRLPYDVEAFRRDVHERIGATAQANAVLAVFDEQRRDAVREHLDFSPGTRLRLPVVEEEQINELKVRASRWRLGAVALLLLCLAVAGVAWIQVKRHPQLVEQVGSPGGEISLANGSLDRSLSLLPTHAVYTDNQPPRGWTYRLHDARSQVVRIDPDQGLVLESQNPEADIEIALPPIYLDGRRKAQIRITGPIVKEVDGELPVLYLDEVYEDGSCKENALSKPAVVLADDGIIRIQRTTRKLPKSLKKIQLRLRCRFRGRLQFDCFEIIPRA